ncbi:MAG: hypothetical protein FRX49_04268 [Trebouxia sp. A1-2]|nr:MAG: hypothetical protein FRX49_04268 [Trebouxia sp. A1-2]
MADSTGFCLQKQCLILCAYTGDLVLLNNLLASRGTEADYKTPRGATALHLAAGRSIVVELLKYGADIASRDNNDRTPLHLAAYVGRIDAVTMLLTKRADANVQDAKGWTPLHDAIQHCGDKEHIVDALLTRADVDAKSTVGMSLIHWAAVVGHADSLELLLSHGATVSVKTGQGRSPLHFACEAGHADMVALLLSHGADVLERRPGSGMTLLHMVCQGAEWEEKVHPELLGLTILLTQWQVEVRQNMAAYPTIVNILVSHGADINARDRQGNTPLHYALKSSFTEAVKLLLDHGAGMDTRSHLGETVLSIAAKHSPPAIVSLLLSHGADAVARDKVHSKTALHCLAQGDQLEMAARLCRKQKDQSADPQLVSTFLLNCMHVKKQLSAPAFRGRVRVKVRVRGCMDPLIDVALKRFAALLSRLLSAGADLEAVDDEGLTPLHTAVKHRHPDLVEILLSYGARGFKMLLVTVRAIQNSESVSLLLAHGADPAVRDNQIAMPTLANPMTLPGAYALSGNNMQECFCESRTSRKMRQL